MSPNAISATFMILDFLLRAGQAAAEWQATVKTARSEGRDLTDAELESIRSRSQTAVDKLLAS